MKLFFYCQHILGIGHFHRSLAICRELSRHFDLTLILGGPEVAEDLSGFQILQLPGLEMDREFQNLRPCTRGATLEETQNNRQEMLRRAYLSQRPDILITELFPFGRKAFRNELLPLLETIKNDREHRCRCYSSVRDILVEKQKGKDKFERKVVETLNTFFDGVLIHSDPAVTTLDKTFSRYHDISIPCSYTGFVCPGTQSKSRKPVGQEQAVIPPGAATSEHLVVASIGGGSVGGELLEATIAAVNLLNRAHSRTIQLQIFHGPYCSPEVVDRCRKQAGAGISIDSFSNNFCEWMASADLSISMAGYNTIMNLAATGTPGLVFPFSQNHEQRLRAELFARHLPLGILKETDLDSESLAKRIAGQLTRTREPGSPISLDGARATTRILLEQMAG